MTINPSSKSLPPDPSAEYSGAISYLEVGDPDGRPLFYFHGWPSSRLQGIHMHESALERGVRVISADRPGMGGSGFIPKRTLHHTAAFIERLADGLGIDDFTVMGVSGGGPHALAVSSLLPDRVTSAAIVCTAPPLAELPDRRAMILPYRLVMPLRHVPSFIWAPIFKVAGLLARCPVNKPPMSWLLRLTPVADREEIQKSKVSGETVTSSFIEASRQGSDALLTDGRIYFQNWKLPYDDIRCPVHFWHGELDKNIPLAMALHLMDKIPSAIRHIIAEEGHYSLPFRYTGDILDDLYRP